MRLKMPYFDVKETQIFKANLFALQKLLESRLAAQKFTLAYLL